MTFPAEWSVDELAERVADSVRRSDSDATRFLVAELVDRCNRLQARVSVLQEFAAQLNPTRDGFDLGGFLDWTLKIVERHGARYEVAL